MCYVFNDIIMSLPAVDMAFILTLTTVFTFIPFAGALIAEPPITVAPHQCPYHCNLHVYLTLRHQTQLWLGPNIAPAPSTHSKKNK